MTRYLKIIGITVCSMALANCASHQASKKTSGHTNNQDPASYQLATIAQYQVHRDDNGFVQNQAIPSEQTYYFAFNSNKIANDYQPALQAQANYLMAHSHAKIRLEGNTDDRGSREYNIGLGWRRAQAVAALLQQQGVLANQIDMVSYGEEYPYKQGENEHAWALNRRVHLVYETQ